MSDFNYYPSAQARKRRAPRVLSAAFGDGYEQRAGDGINTSPQSWDLEFTRATSEIDVIEAFFAAKAGVTSFTWTPPDGTEIRVVCREWTRNYPAPGVGSIACRFDQVFGE